MTKTQNDQKTKWQKDKKEKGQKDKKKNCPRGNPAWLTSGSKKGLPSTIAEEIIFAKQKPMYMIVGQSRIWAQNILMEYIGPKTNITKAHMKTAST